MASVKGLTLLLGLVFFGFFANATQGRLTGSPSANLVEDCEYQAMYEVIGVHQSTHSTGLSCQFQPLIVKKGVRQLGVLYWMHVQVVDETGSCGLPATYEVLYRISLGSCDFSRPRLLPLVN